MRYCGVLLGFSHGQRATQSFGFAPGHQAHQDLCGRGCSCRSLDGVDFVAASGEFVVILGPSGSGKSTFLNLIGGLDTASAGQAWFRDWQITGADDSGLTRYRRNHVGFVFQFYNLVPSLTARENVQLVTDIATNHMAPAEALALVELADRLDDFTAQLYGGGPQRV